MTKLSVDSGFAKGVARQSDIEAMTRKAASRPQSSLPGWLSDAVNLAISGGVGGACAWVVIKFLM